MYTNTQPLIINLDEDCDNNTKLKLDGRRIMLPKFNFIGPKTRFV